MNQTKTIKQLLILHELIEDVKEYGLQEEFKTFVDNNPDMDIEEIDAQFRNEWDI